MKTFDSFLLESLVDYKMFTRGKAAYKIRGKSSFLVTSEVRDVEPLGRNFVDLKERNFKSKS